MKAQYTGSKDTVLIYLEGRAECRPHTKNAFSTFTSSSNPLLSSFPPSSISISFLPVARLVLIETITEQGGNGQRHFDEKRGSSLDDDEERRSKDLGRLVNFVQVMTEHYELAWKPVRPVNGEGRRRRKQVLDETERGRRRRGGTSSTGSTGEKRLRAFFFFFHRTGSI